MKIATWNVDSVRARLPKVLDWLESAAPDVLCMQEIKSITPARPVSEDWSLGRMTAGAGTVRQGSARDPSRRLKSLWLEAESS